MKYKTLDGIATADVAYEIYGKTIEELFINAAQAVTQTMVDLTTVQPLLNSKFKIQSLSRGHSTELSRGPKSRGSKLEDLLLDFLNELVFLKDAKQRIFSRFDIQIKKLDAESYQLDAIIWGEKIDIKKHKLRCDVKAVTKHKFFLKKEKGKYVAQIVLDI